MERTDFRALRDALSEDEVLSARKKIFEALKSIFDARDFKTVLTYYPRGHELDVGEFNEYVLGKGVKVAFPRVDSKSHDIYFYEVNSLEDFDKGTFGLMEPKPDTKRVYIEPRDAFGSPETSSVLCVTPGVAFDSRKNRMGYGAGYYDKFFLANMGIYKVGCAYSCQMVEKLEIKPHDVKMNEVIVV